MAWKEAAFLMDTFNYMNANPAIADNGANTFRDLAAPEYGLYDKVSWFRGVLETLDVVYPQLWEVDFRTQATKLEVPVYFLIGRHDINAPDRADRTILCTFSKPRIRKSSGSSIPGITPGSPNRRALWR